MPEYDLSALSAPDVFRLAWEKSGLPKGELIKRLGAPWDEHYFNKVMSYDAFYPAYERLPHFCRVVNNTLVIEWLFTQAGGSPYAYSDSIEPYDLLEAVNVVFSNAGKVSSAVQDAIADKKITRTEMRSIIRELIPLIDSAIGLTGNLRNAERESSKRKGGEQ